MGLGCFQPGFGMKEDIKRFLEKNLQTTSVPITENIQVELVEVMLN